jgi:hypothetical protein
VLDEQQDIADRTRLSSLNQILLQAKSGSVIETAEVNSRDHDGTTIHGFYDSSTG